MSKPKRKLGYAAACGTLLASTLVLGCMNYGGGTTSSTLPITGKDAYTSLDEVSGEDGTRKITFEVVQ